MKIKVIESVVKYVEADGRIVDVDVERTDAAVPVKMYAVERVRREVLHRAMPGGGYIVEKLGREALLAQQQHLEQHQQALSSRIGMDQYQQQQQQQLEERVGSLNMGMDRSPPNEGEASTSPVGSTASSNPMAVAGGNIVELDEYGIPGLLGEVHRHSLEYSDSIKKYKVQREMLKRSKELKKQQVSGLDF
jgi:hypothetical protein